MVINITEIIDILGLDDDQAIDLDGSDNLADYHFDSLAIVLLQSFLDEECNIQIDPDELPEFEKISDLDEFIKLHKKNAKN